LLVWTGLWEDRGEERVREVRVGEGKGEEGMGCERIGRKRGKGKGWSEG